MAELTMEKRLQLAIALQQILMVKKNGQDYIVIMKSLEIHFGRMTSIGSLHNKFIISGKVINKLSKPIFRKKFDYNYIRSNFVVTKLAKIIKKETERKTCDILFF